MKGRRNDPLTRRWADETALNPHLFANLKLISQLSVSTCHFADWFQTVFVIFKKKSGIGCEICIFCYSRFEKYGHPFTSGALILYKLVVRSWPVICVYIFSLMSFFLNCMLEVGTIFPAALSCFLFSSGASTRLQLMAFTYGVPQSHLLDTHTHVHAHSVEFLWTSDQPVTENSIWQHTILTETYVYVLGGFRARNPSKQEATDLYLGPCSHNLYHSLHTWIEDSGEILLLECFLQMNHVLQLRNY